MLTFIIIYYIIGLIFAGGTLMLSKDLYDKIGGDKSFVSPLLVTLTVAWALPVVAVFAIMSAIVDLLTGSSK